MKVLNQKKRRKKLKYLVYLMYVRKYHMDRKFIECNFWRFNLKIGIKFTRNVILANLDNWNIIQTILSGMF